MELPEECIASILSRTTPVDAVVSKIFRSAADSHAVWDRFLPSEYHSIVSHSPPPSSKKALFLALSDHPVIIDQGKKSIQLDRKSGNKCYMLAARALSIAWGDDERYWSWKTCKESRFPEIAVLNHVWWLEIRGIINTLSLSPNTHYGAFLVFRDYCYHYPVELSISILGGDNISTKNVCLDSRRKGMGPLRRHYGIEELQCPTVRKDGWLEIEMGEFFNSGLEDEKLQMSVVETKSWKRGLHLEGIEVRPKKIIITLKEQSMQTNMKVQILLSLPNFGDTYYIFLLPEECIAVILSHTTPADAARLSVVSKTFCSAANSDVVWDSFLPSDYHPNFSRSPLYVANVSSKKALYLAAHRPLIFDKGKMSFQLGGKSGKKCYMLAARALISPDHFWLWTTHPKSRFREVAILNYVWCLEIRGMINTLSLSPNTHYGAFLVFTINTKNCSHGFKLYPLGLSVSIDGRKSITKNVGLFGNPRAGLERPRVRSDGWLEIELGEFFNSGLEDKQVHMSVLEINDYKKGGFIVEGIEIRPKEDN